MADSKKVTKKQLEEDNATLREAVTNGLWEFDAKDTEIEELEERLKQANVVAAEKDTQIAELDAKLALSRLEELELEEENSGILAQLQRLGQQAEFMVYGLGTILTYHGPNLETPRRLAKDVLEAVSSTQDPDV